MNEYVPEYVIIDPADMLPPEEMTLDPEKELAYDRFALTELKNIKRGIPYKAVHGDTPESRYAINMKLGYFQMVAHMEGWKFDPQMYQVKFIDPESPLFERDGKMRRMFTFEEGAPDLELSPENNVGFKVLCDEEAERMEDDEVDGGMERILRLF